MDMSNYSSSSSFSKRCLISHRPPFRTKDPQFYRCPVCGSVTVRNIPSGAHKIHHEAVPVQCCGEPAELLIPLEGERTPEGHQIDFTVFGGLDGNAVRIAVDDGYHPMQGEHRIEWAYFRTFSGGQLKFLPASGRAVVTFAFADEDAYVYCNRDICRMGKEHCQFTCKRGNAVYVYCSVHGLTKLELNGF